MSCFELERTSKYISTLYEWLTYRKQPQLVLKWKVLRAVSVCVCDSAVSMLTSDSPAVDIRAFPEKSSTSRNILAATSVASPAGSPEESSPHWSCKTLSPIQSKSLLKLQTVALCCHEIWCFNLICLKDIFQIKRIVLKLLYIVTSLRCIRLASAKCICNANVTQCNTIYRTLWMVIPILLKCLGCLGFRVGLIMCFSDTDEFCCIVRFLAAQQEMRNKD